jgi:hypothetical protein
MRFLDTMQAPERLVGTKAASLRIARFGAEIVYAGDLVLRYYLVAM